MTRGSERDEERALVERFLRRGDESAFRLLYQRHTGLLYRMACRMVNDVDRAAEVVQETWLRAARGLPSFRWESSLATWLVGIVVNRSREEIRRHAENVAPADGITAGAPEQDPVQRLDLDRAMARLPEGYREVLVLHDVEGFTHEEIAAALGIEAATSRSQLTRARAAMRVLLEQKVESP